MTKTKGFWAAIAALSLAAAAISGYSIYNRLTVHLAKDTVQFGPSRVPQLPDPEETEEAPAKTAAQPQDLQTDNREEPARPKAVKTRFEYRNSSAKRVLLAGSFTSWKEIPLAKKNGVWKADVFILPGNYLYHFIVDGKKTADPTKPKSPFGESIAAVENGAAQN
ncbi:MAG TPA: glycogen-binding domain-containing protein [Elusimicrobiales bacterium]|nr:glycogen-binding domain-containing protein [Elusimicrobiales bacterium]